MEPDEQLGRSEARGGGGFAEAIERSDGKLTPLAARDRQVGAKVIELHDAPC